jgi:ABC-type bacteriocin/lantibiotic exporter with double-glycine peptidase domain
MKDTKLAGMLVSLVPAFLIMSLVGSRYTEKYSGQMSDHIASAPSIASEGLSNVIVVHAFRANARIESRFVGYLMQAQRAGIKKAVATAIQTGLLYFIAYSGNALAFWQGSKTIADSVGLTRAETTVGTTYTVIFILVDGQFSYATLPNLVLTASRSFPHSQPSRTISSELWLCRCCLQEVGKGHES